MEKSIKKCCSNCKHDLDNCDHIGCLSQEYSLWEPKDIFFDKCNNEKDPSGIAQHTPGAKLDDGKLMANILQQFPRALTAVLEVATFGAKKYSRGGWLHVENGIERYSDAMMRHYLQEPIEPIDPDSGLTHEAHLAWNALARLELKLRKENGND